MKLKKLLEWPSSKFLKISLIIGFALSITVIPIMQYFTTLSGFPANIFSSQLNFNGVVMKSYYALTDVDLYRIAPSLDYFFMIGYGLILFTSSVLMARRYKKSKFQQIGLIFAIFGVTAAICDGIENIFILAMLTDPIGFPNAWTVIHSIFALIKWILLFIDIMGVVLLGILSIIKGKEIVME